MTNRVLWSAIALVGLIFSSGCCCGPCGSCGDSCGLGLDLGGRYDECGTNCCDTGCNSGCGCSSGGKTYCGKGCGEKYWSDWGNRCDSCDCDGNFTGQCCEGHFSWLDDCWLSLWGFQCCNSHNSRCDGGCHGGGCMGDNCPSCNFGGFGGRHNSHGGNGSGGCSSCGHNHSTESYGPASKPSSQIRESEPTPAPPLPKPSATSYRPSRSSVVTMSPPSGKAKTTGNSVRQVQYESNPTTRTASTTNRSTSNTATTTRTTASPQRATAEKATMSRAPQSAQDFDLPPGAQIIKIEDN